MVLADDTEDTLAARVLEQEHMHPFAAVTWPEVTGVALLAGELPKATGDVPLAYSVHENRVNGQERLRND